MDHKSLLDSPFPSTKLIEDPQVPDASDIISSCASTSSIICVEYLVAIPDFFAEHVTLHLELGFQLLYYHLQLNEHLLQLQNWD